MLLGKNMVVMVTGASSGLGRSLAIEAGRRGAKVVLVARRSNILKKLQDFICSKDGEAVALQTDIRVPSSIIDAFKKVDSIWGRIDILLNNAGVVGPLAPLVQISDDELLTSLSTNVFGVYMATREALKRMLKQTNGGTIINITSGAARNPYASWSAYCSQKAAVEMFTRCVALEVADTPIRVAAISPGPFESRMQERIRRASSKVFPSRDKFVNLYKQGQLGKPEKIAKIIMEISLSSWQELSGMVEDLRSEDFQEQCVKQGITIFQD